MIIWFHVQLKFLQKKIYETASKCISFEQTNRTWKGRRWENNFLMYDAVQTIFKK